VKSNLEKGAPFYTAFAKYPKVFSQVYVNSIKAGEASGSLESIFENLATSLSKEKVLRDQIKSALFYPLILLVASVLILIFLVIFALPKIAKVFSERGFEPPLFSKVVFSVGLFFGNFGGVILTALAILAVLFFVLYRTSFVFKKFILSITFNLPLIKEVVKKVSIQRFAATLSSLIKAGMPITDALEITADSITQIEMKEALVRISREGIAKGLTVGEAFKREPFFPKTVVNLIAISERAGHIEEVLQTLADFYTSEIDSSLKTLVAFLEPLMLMGIGLVIGGIALAIVIPIYQLTIQF
jgi:type II secretory pathway component PulF